MLHLPPVYYDHNNNNNMVIVSPYDQSSAQLHLMDEWPAPNIPSLDSQGIESILCNQYLSD